MIECSTEDGNAELTALLLELKRKLREGLIVYPADDKDTRVVGRRYDVIREVYDVDHGLRRIDEKYYDYIQQWAAKQQKRFIIETWDDNGESLKIINGMHPVDVWGWLVDEYEEMLILEDHGRIVWHENEGGITLTLELDT